MRVNVRQEALKLEWVLHSNSCHTVENIVKSGILLRVTPSLISWY